MNKRQIVASLNSIANELDSKGLFKEANEVTEVMVRLSQYAGLKPGSAAGRAVGVNNPDPKNIQYSGSTSYKPNANLRDPKNIQYSGSTEYKPYEPMPPYDLVPDSPQDTVPDSPKPADKPNLGKKPGTPSKPGTTDSSTPKSSEGLSRWVNKAENIYSAWVSKGARPSTDAEGLIQDIIDYMEKVKQNMRPSLHSAADYKIDKVKALKLAISSGITMPSSAITTPYGAVSGFPGKGVNPFTYDPSKRLTGNALDYQARQEGKSI